MRLEAHGTIYDLPWEVSRREIDQATAATFAIRLAACGMSVKFSDCCELAVGHKSEELAADESYSNRSYVR